MMLVAPLVLATRSGLRLRLRRQLLHRGGEDRGGRSRTRAPGRACPPPAPRSPPRSPVADMADLLAVTEVGHPRGGPRSRGRRRRRRGGHHPVRLVVNARPAPVRPTAEVRDLQGPDAHRRAPPSSTAVVDSVVQSLNGARAAAATAVQLAASLGVTDAAQLADVASKAADVLRPRRRNTKHRSRSTERTPVVRGRGPGEAPQRRQPGAGRHDAVLHAVRRGHSRAQHPRRAPAGHALPALHHPHAAQRDPGGQVHRRVPGGARAGGGPHLGRLAAVGSRLGRAGAGGRAHVCAARSSPLLSGL